MKKQNLKTYLSPLNLVVLALLMMSLYLVVFLSISSPQTLYAQGGSFGGTSGADPGSVGAGGGKV